MDQDSFVELVRVHLSCYGMKLKISNKKLLKSDWGSITGWFDDTGGIFLAGKNKRWFAILVHEYCHFLQWEESCPLYARFDRHYAGWDSWLLGLKNLRSKDLHIKFLAIRNLELDCEMRTVKLIKKYNLPVDVKKYIQDANAYMFFYAYVKKYRTWPDAPISQKIKDIMPVKFLKQNTYNEMSQKFEDLMNKYCI